MIILHLLGPEQSKNSHIIKVLTPWLGAAALLQRVSGTAVIFVGLFF